MSAGARSRIPSKPTGSKYGSTDFGGVGARVAYTDVPPELVSRVVQSVTEQGDCIMFSRTSDGGALHVRILADGLIEKWYPSSSQELMDVLSGIQDAAERASSST